MVSWEDGVGSPHLPFQLLTLRGWHQRLAVGANNSRELRDQVQAVGL